MFRHNYPFNLKYVMEAALKLPPVLVPKIDDFYFLALGVTNLCNFDCPFCYYHEFDHYSVNNSLSIKIAENIFNNLPILSGVIIGLEGEPLLYRDLIELLKLANEHAKGLTLITNGSLFTERLCDEISELKIYKVILSIDGSDSDTYEYFRKNGNFRKFQEVATMIASRFPCQLHATVFRQNLDSLLGLPSLAHSLGIKHISFQQLRPLPGICKKGIAPATFEELSRWLPALIQKAHILNIEVEFERNFGGTEFRSLLRKICQSAALNYPTSKPNHCVHADRLACILSDGKLFPCAGDFEPISLLEYTFDSIFNNPYLQALRAIHQSGKEFMPCRVCMNDSYL